MSIICTTPNNIYQAAEGTEGGHYDDTKHSKPQARLEKLKLPTLCERQTQRQTQTFHYDIFGRKQRKWNKQTKGSLGE